MTQNLDIKTTDFLKEITQETPLVIYTDGACSGNPGLGGWGALLLYKGQELEIFGGDRQTTNNRMEMMAAIQSLQILPPKTSVTLFTDSQYLRDGITKWMINWKKNGWQTADKKPVKNRDLWERLDLLLAAHMISWNWVKGHSNHPLNDRADALARNGIIAQRMSI